MHTELTFLIELLLNHKLQKATKDAIAARIQNIGNDGRLVPSSGNMANSAAAPSAPFRAVTSGVAAQAPSTLAILARNPDLAEKAQATPVPIEAIAQTPAAAVALQERQAAINAAISGQVVAKGGNPEIGRKSPRKF